MPSDSGGHTDRQRLPQANLKLPAQVVHVLNVLSQAGYEAFLVGGCVRDTLLGRSVHDYDVATNAHPEAVQGLFTHVIPTGIGHGTVTVTDGHFPVEVTTYRIEADYLDGRHPDKVAYAERLSDDLLRRDFTINAVAMDGAGKLVDPLNGQRDLHRRLIRAVGDPSERFSEDGLRIIRALRFAAQLGFTIETSTHRAMTFEVLRLQAVSMERVGQELLKIAAGNWFVVLPDLALGPYLHSTKQPLDRLQRAFAKVHRIVSSCPELGWERWRKIFGSDTDALRAFPPAQWPGTPLFRPNLAAIALWMAHMTSQSTITALFRSLAWQKSFVSTAVETARLLRARPWTWSEFRWREALLESDLSALYTASALADWLKPTDRHTSCRIRLFDVFQETPLRSVRELAVSGHQLAAFGLVGPQIGITIRKLVHAVISEKVENSEDDLRRFLFHA